MHPTVTSHEGISTGHMFFVSVGGLGVTTEVTWSFCAYMSLVVGQFQIINKLQGSFKYWKGCLLGGIELMYGGMVCNIKCKYTTGHESLTYPSTPHLWTNFYSDSQPLFKVNFIRMMHYPPVVKRGNGQSSSISASRAVRSTPRAVRPDPCPPSCCAMCGT